MSSKSNSIYKLICIQSQSILESSNGRQLRHICSLEKAQGKKLGLARSVCISTSSHTTNTDTPKSKEHMLGNPSQNLPSDHSQSPQILLQCVFAFVLLGPSRNVNIAFPKAHGASLRWLTDLQFLILSPLALSGDLWDQLLFSQPLGMPWGGPELCCEWRYSHPAYPEIDGIRASLPSNCRFIGQLISSFVCEGGRECFSPDIHPQSQFPPEYHVIQGPYSPMDVGAKKKVGRCFPQKGKLRFFGKGEGCRISHKKWFIHSLTLPITHSDATERLISPYESWGLV